MQTVSAAGSSRSSDVGGPKETPMTPSDAFHAFDASWCLTGQPT